MAESIKEMNKDSLLLFMKASRELYHFDDSLKSWQRAIELYRATGNKFDSDCSGCRRRLIEWLEA